jgi:2-methylcitrate dehydratase PrpD
MISAQLAQFACHDSPLRADDAVFARTIDLCISALGSALLGATTDIPLKVVDHVRHSGATGNAGAIGFGFTTSAEHAALLNCTTSHATEYEDVSWPDGHYTNSLIPAMFSLGEELDASGSAVLDAIIAGFEVGSRPAATVGKDVLARGFLSGACLGAIAAAAGAARLLKLDAAGTQRAITNAASMAGGLIRQAGSSIHVLEAGLAARNGISAALLARLGIGGIPSIMDGPRGFYDAYGGHENVSFELGNGADFRVMAVGQKKYPCGYRSQRLLDALLSIIQDHGLTAEKIALVEIHVNGAFTRFMKFDDPTTIEEARLSVLHAVSAALAWGYVDFRAFTDAAILDPALRAQRPKIRIVEHAEWGDDMMGSADHVIIETPSGERFEAIRSGAHGDGDDPLSRAETIAKFRACTDSIIAPSLQDAILAEIEGLRNSPSVRPLMAMLTHAERGHQAHADAAG